MKIAIVADWLNCVGGAERVLVELHRMFPDAPIYTSVYDPSELPAAMQGWDVRPSFLQRIPFARRRHRAFLPLMPMAFEQMDLREYDLVISTSSACAKGVITRPDALHVCYCYTPTRYLWDLYHEYTGGHPARLLIAPIAHWLRIWDRLAADRVDHFVAISREVAGRIRRHYNRESEVIYPPVSVDQIQPNRRPAEDFYLVVSRLVPYKRVDLAVRAARQSRRRLIVVGDGPERRALKSLAGPTVEFVGRLEDPEVADLYARCRALLFPGLEDFGITPVEAQAAGRPVIAFGRGGATETVVDGVTGLLFSEQSVDSLTRAMQRLESSSSFDPVLIRRNAERFDASLFRARLQATVERHLEQAEEARSRIRTQQVRLA